VRAYNPAAMGSAEEVLKSGVEFAKNPYEAAKDADALLVLTEWEEFACLDLDRLRKLLKYPIVLDGRNLYDPATMAEHGLSHYSVGRPAAVTENDAAEVQPKKRERA
jgi:UDPglucose 6-dehydrogenase